MVFFKKRQQIKPERHITGSHSYLSAFQIQHLTKLPLSLFNLLITFFYRQKKLFSLCSQPDAPGCTDKQLCTKALLQLSDCLAYSRL